MKCESVRACFYMVGSGGHFAACMRDCPEQATEGALEFAAAICVFPVERGIDLGKSSRIASRFARLIGAHAPGFEAKGYITLYIGYACETSIPKHYFRTSPVSDKPLRTSYRISGEILVRCQLEG